MLDFFPATDFVLTPTSWRRLFGRVDRLLGASSSFRLVVAPRFSRTYRPVPRLRQLRRGRSGRTRTGFSGSGGRGRWWANAPVSHGHKRSGELLQRALAPYRTAGMKLRANSTGAWNPCTLMSPALRSGTRQKVTGSLLGSPVSLPTASQAVSSVPPGSGRRARPFWAYCFDSRCREAGQGRQVSATRRESVSPDSTEPCPAQCDFRA